MTHTIYSYYFKIKTKKISFINKILDDDQNCDKITYIWNNLLLPLLSR